MIPKHGDDLGPAWTAGAGLAWYAWMVLACANPKDTGRTDNPLCQIDLIAMASVFVESIKAHEDLTTREGETKR